ncbi:GvpL/GvpF family gas vesicle protein [Streptomyces collinus]|uniref:GvpL/GvpF family gas vesicle protein n=1 Tax=Streptomyces collinus TaxID=42684 RepID=UPI0036BC139F
MITSSDAAAVTTALLQQALEPTAEAVSVGPQSTGWLANRSFLVDRGSAEQFLNAVDGLRQEHPHLELRVHGPLPPYSFVDTPSSEQAEGGTAKAFGAATAQPTNG